MKIKIEIKHILGKVLFEYEKENNNLKDTLVEAVKRGAYLRGAYLRGADLQGADLRGAYLQEAYLRGAYLQGAYLRGADLQGAYLRGAYLQEAYLRGADLRGAYLRGADLQGAYLRGMTLDKLPQDFINQASRDMLFIFEHLKSELPFLKEKLIAGEVDGSQYEGECACLIGTLAKKKGNGDGISKVCEAIPYYEKGIHNIGENWFLNINKGDTPENNEFAKHVLVLIDSILNKGRKIKKQNL